MMRGRLPGQPVDRLAADRPGRPVRQRHLADHHGRCAAAIVSLDPLTRAGGDNCSRNMFVQSFNAALEGLSAIPTAWTQKATLYPQVLQWAQQLVARRGTV